MHPTSTYSFDHVTDTFVFTIKVPRKLVQKHTRDNAKRMRSAADALYVALQMAAESALVQAIRDLVMQGKRKSA
jgi:hypothetical protein